MNICQEIQCPYFASSLNGYGCRRYSVSNHCHLLKEFSDLDPNQYVLGARESTNTNSIKATNNQFFLQDEKYQEDREFLKTHPGWFSDSSFKVGEIKV